MEIDCSNTFLGQAFGKRVGNTIVIDCFGNNKRNLITEYNRKPEVYKSTSQSLSEFLRNGVSDVYSSLVHFQDGPKSTNNAKYRGSRAQNDEYSRVNIRQLWNTLLCISGAGLGMVSLSLLGIFGVCAAAGVSCSAMACNKCLKRHDTVQGHKCAVVPLSVSNEYKPISPVNKRVGFYPANTYIPMYGKSFNY